MYSLLTFDSCKDILFDSCTFRNVWNVAIQAANCDNIRITNCSFKYVANKCIFTENCKNVIIKDNNFTNCGDICHINKSSQSVIFQSNIGADAGTIALQGCKRAVVNDNNLSRSKYTAIDIDVSDDLVDNDITCNCAITVSNNVICDVIEAEWYNDDQTSYSDYGKVYIALHNRNIASDANSVLSTEYSDFYTNYNPSNASSALRATEGIVIVGNVLKRTLPSGVAYSAWGHGKAFIGGQRVFHDTIVEEAALRGVGILLEIPLKNVTIEGNHISTGNYGIVFESDNEITIPNHSLRSVHIIGNNISDCTSGAISWNIAKQVLSHQDIRIAHNTIDCDPYFYSPNHVSNGSWQASSFPYGINMPYVGSIEVVGNSFRNCCIPLRSTGAENYQHISRNILVCDAATTGFSTNNKGCGYVYRPAPESWWIRWEDSNPQSANYGISLGDNPKASGSMPKAGKWLAGTMVYSTDTTQRLFDIPNIDSHAYIITGWVRLTTGNNHVLNTDWRELRTIISQV